LPELQLVTSAYTVTTAVRTVAYFVVLTFQLAGM